MLIVLCRMGVERERVAGTKKIKNETENRGGKRSNNETWVF
jgi:hypothetical protein